MINFDGLLLGAGAFLCIGMFHPLVIKLEYYFGVKSWWVFMVIGIVGTVVSMLVTNDIISALLGVFAFSAFWGIGEIFKQKERVQKGWFPKNPKRNYDE